MLEPILRKHHEYQLQTVNGMDLYFNSGIRQEPDHEGLNLLLRELKKDLKAQTQLLDVSSSAGYLSAFYPNSIILESSYTGLRAAQKSFAKNRQYFAGAIWQFPIQAEAVALIISADKGSKRVEAEIKGAYNSLKNGAAAYILSNKNLGAKSYEKNIKNIFGNNRVIAKKANWRLSKAVKSECGKKELEKTEFEALSLKLMAEPGVYAAGKLDPGSEFLLDSLDLSSLKGKTVLDIGAGYGILSLKASLAGATVTALDDDLLAIQSCYKNAQRYGLDIRCLHSDVNSVLNDREVFDVVLTNPPFHLGKRVKMDIAFAFIAAAHKHLKTNGELFLVANKALHYEPLLKEFSQWRQLAENKSFKVLWAKK